LSGLTRSGIPGLDPAGAAGILNAADASVRRGGGFGEAGLNLTYAALARSTPGLTPFSVAGLYEGGLFGTTEGVFGPKGALGQYAARNGLALPQLNGVTNFSKIRGLLGRQYGQGSWLYLDALRNYFGLSSLAQAAALDGTSPVALGQSDALLKRVGIGLTDLNASGIAGITKIASAGAFGDLAKIAGSVSGRGDLSAGERESLQRALGSGNFQTLQDELARIVGRHGQEETEGSRTRDSIADLKNELTRVGSALLEPINLIRIAVEKIAGITHPDGIVPSGPDTTELTPFNALQFAEGGAGFVNWAAPGAAITKKSAFDAYFSEAARLFHVDPQDLKAIGIAESSLDPNARNGKALGLMQLGEGARHDLGVTEPFNARSSIMGGAQYLSQMLQKSGGDLTKALEMYHRGPNGVITDEDIAYAKKVEAIRQGLDVKLGVSGTVTINDQNGRDRGTGDLTVTRPFVSRPPDNASGWLQ
jgi:hypothetical protein